MPKKPVVTWLLTHQIQYFVNLLDELSARGNIEVNAIYAHDTSKILDPGFGKQVDWNVRPNAKFPFCFLDDTVKKELNPPFSTFSRDLFKKLRAINPDVIQLNGYSNLMQWQGMAWSRLHRKYFFIRGDGDVVSQSSFRHRNLRHLVTRTMLKDAAIVFSQGKQNTKYFIEAGADKSQLRWIPCVSDSGMSTFQFQSQDERAEFRSNFGSDEQDVIFIFCGKLIPRKRLDDVLEAIALVKHLPAKVWVLGSGELETSHRQKIQHLGISDKVCMMGFQSQDQIPKFLHAADVLVHPSELDPWPYSVLDAASCALPLLLSDKTGCLEDWKSDPPAALGFSCGDVEDLAKKIKLLTESKSTRVELGGNAKFHASHHNEKIFCDLYEDFVMGVMSKKSEKPPTFHAPFMANA